jgi:iron complex transport system substrate-binding protein
VIVSDQGHVAGTDHPIQTHPFLSKLAAVQAKRVAAMDADIMSRPGPRLVDFIERLAAILHPAS